MAGVPKEARLCCVLGVTQKWQRAISSPYWAPLDASDLLEADGPDLALEKAAFTAQQALAWRILEALGGVRPSVSD